MIVASAMAGCRADSAPAAAGLDTCEFARDGECDEPTNCALGTDSTDCAAACATEEGQQFFPAACAHREDAPPESTPGPGTGGTVHLTGYRDGTIVVTSGASASTQVHRHYRLYVPATYDPSRPTPLVLNMPGHRVEHYALSEPNSLERTADMNGFIVAFLEQEWRWSDLRYAWWTDWDWRNRPNDNPDLVFLRRVVEKVGDEYNLDRTRVFATGHSRGAAMSVIAALEMPDLIAGANPHSGFTEFGYDKRIEAYAGARKVPMYIFHGANDPDVPVGRSDLIVQILRTKGWSDDELVYYRPNDVTHRWQPYLNQEVYDWLHARPLPVEEL